MTIDTIFLCFCEDSIQNDGLSRPFYMSRNLMEFIQNSKQSLDIVSMNGSKKKAWNGSSENGTNGNVQTIA